MVSSAQGPPHPAGGEVLSAGMRGAGLKHLESRIWASLLEAGPKQMLLLRRVRVHQSRDQPIPAPRSLELSLAPGSSLLISLQGECSNNLAT